MGSYTTGGGNDPSAADDAKPRTQLCVAAMAAHSGRRAGACAGTAVHGAHESAPAETRSSDASDRDADAAAIANHAFRQRDSGIMATP